MDTLSTLGLKGKPKKVLGHTIAEPRLTGVAVALIGACLVLPVVVLGSVADFAMQWLFGVCTGIWCFWS